MLISCKYCSGIHDRRFTCPARPKRYGKKEITNISKFRNTAGWKRKRTEIKQRDKYLCQVCKMNGIYIFEQLDVHHITAISADWNRRLDSLNLITLCKKCHFHADKGDIDKALLYRLSSSAELIQAHNTQ